MKRVILLVTIFISNFIISAQGWQKENEYFISENQFEKIIEIKMNDDKSTILLIDENLVFFEISAENGNIINQIDLKQLSSDTDELFLNPSADISFEHEQVLLAFYSDTTLNKDNSTNRTTLTVWSLNLNSLQIDYQQEFFFDQENYRENWNSKVFGLFHSGIFILNKDNYLLNAYYDLIFSSNGSGKKYFSRNTGNIVHVDKNVDFQGDPFELNKGAVKKGMLSDEYFFYLKEYAEESTSQQNFYMTGSTSLIKMDLISFSADTIYKNEYFTEERFPDKPGEYEQPIQTFAAIDESNLIAINQINPGKNIFLNNYKDNNFVPENDTRIIHTEFRTNVTFSEDGKYFFDIKTEQVGSKINRIPMIKNIIDRTKTTLAEDLAFNPIFLDIDYKNKITYLATEDRIYKIPEMSLAKTSAYIYADKYFAAIDEEIKFGSIIVGDYDSLEWDFADGTNSEMENPLHSFSEKGNFNVGIQIVKDGKEFSSEIAYPIEIFEAIDNWLIKNEKYYLNEDLNYIMQLDVGNNGNQFAIADKIGIGIFEKQTGNSDDFVELENWNISDLEFDFNTNSFSLNNRENINYPGIENNFNLNLPYFINKIDSEWNVSVLPEIEDELFDEYRFYSFDFVEVLGDYQYWGWDKRPKFDENRCGIISRSENGEINPLNLLKINSGASNLLGMESDDGLIFYSYTVSSDNREENINLEYFDPSNGVNRIIYSEDEFSIRKDILDTYKRYFLYVSKPDNNIIIQDLSENKSTLMPAADENFLDAGFVFHKDLIYTLTSNADNYILRTYRITDNSIVDEYRLEVDDLQSIIVEPIGLGQFLIAYNQTPVNNPNVRRSFVFKHEFDLVISVENDAVEQTDIEIFPNPAKGFVNISTSGQIICSVEIMNLSGQTVRKVENLSGIPAKIDVSELSAGTYVVLVKTKAGIFREKFIIL